MLGQLGLILEQLGDKMRPKSAKISQDGAKMANLAPRWSAKMAKLRRNMADLPPFWEPSVQIETISGHLFEKC